MDVEAWMLRCLFAGSCPKVMMRGKHIPQFQDTVRAIEARWRKGALPACPTCGKDALELDMGDGDATTDSLRCSACGAESEELGMLLDEQPDPDPAREGE